jgi:prepilin-type N-terminal cleavage/methylation domain-containing protein
MARTASRTTPNLGSQPLCGADFERAHSSAVLGEDVRDRRRGFTIVELLIVVVVIAILAAITIVAYNGINNRAKASAASSAAQQAAKKVMTYAVTNAEQYPATLSDAGVSDSGSTSYQYRVDNTGNPKTFCLTATSQNVSYFVSNAAPTPSAGACPGHALDGGVAITNLARNPGANNINYWGTYGGGVGGGATPVTLSIVTASWAPSGSAARVTASAGATSTHAELGGIRNYSVTAPTSGTISVSVQMRASSTRPASGFLRVRQAGIADIVGPSVTLGTTPQTVQVTATGLTPGVAYGVSYKENGTATFPSGDYIEASALMLVDGPSIYPYADGNSTGWMWNGAANSSTSTGPAR